MAFYRCTLAEEYVRNTFGNNYTLNIPSGVGTITQLMVLIYRDGYGLWNGSGDNNNYVLLWTGTAPYYDTTNNKMVRTGGVYYAIIQNVKYFRGDLRAQPKETINFSYVANPSTDAPVALADLDKYCVANLTDILDQNGNVVLQSNHSLADFGIS